MHHQLSRPARGACRSQWTEPVDPGLTRSASSPRLLKDRVDSHPPLMVPLDPMWYAMGEEVITMAHSPNHARKRSQQPSKGTLFTLVKLRVPAGPWRIIKSRAALEGVSATRMAIDLLEEAAAVTPAPVARRRHR